MSVTEYKFIKILFIKGVFLKDCIPSDDIFEKQMIEQLQYNTAYIEVYNKIPLIFTSMETWVKKTNLSCWHCCLEFDSIPVFIPKIIDSSAFDKFNISTYGCFCSFNCAMAYNNIYNKKICDNIHVKNMLLFLYKIYTKKSVKEILPSPSKYQMNHYGGNLEKIQYKKKIIKIKEAMKLLEYNKS
jgi:hypothetical protein